MPERPVEGFASCWWREFLATVTKHNLSLHFMAPQVTYSFVRNASNSAFDDYTSHTVDARLVKEF